VCPFSLSHLGRLSFDFVCFKIVIVLFSDFVNDGEALTSCVLKFYSFGDFCKTRHSFDFRCLDS